MMKTGILLFYSLFSVFSCIQGACDGILRYKGSDGVYSFSEKIIILLRIAIVFPLIYFSRELQLNDLSFVLWTGLLSFFFFHNVSYHVARKFVNDQYSWSKNSTGVMIVSSNIRLFLFCTSIVKIVFYLWISAKLK